MSKSTIRPLHDRVVIRQVAEEEKTAGGIIIPDTSKEKPSEGEVVAVGTGMILSDGSVRPLELKEGDRVLFAAWQAGNSKVKVNGEDLLVMREDDIIAVYN